MTERDPDPTSEDVPVSEGADDFDDDIDAPEPANDVVPDQPEVPA